MHKTKVKITSLKNFDEVDFTATVKGHVSPKNSKVQVYVLSADNKWYLQKHSCVKWGRWSAECNFGLAGSFGNEYVVAAVLTDERPTSPLEALPADVPKSEFVMVSRKSMQW